MLLNSLNLLLGSVDMHIQSSAQDTIGDLKHLEVSWKTDGMQYPVVDERYVRAAPR